MGFYKKEKTYPGQHDLSLIIPKFTEMLKEDKWRVQDRTEKDRAVVQAMKTGFLRGLIAADRALTFTFDQTSGDLHVTTGVGKWLGNLAITAIEVIFLSDLFLFVDVPEMLWTEKVEKDILQKLDMIVQ